jgi:hypothetical protein
MIDPQLAFMDARANQYAKHFGTTPDEWWSRWIAGVERAEDDIGDLLQFQPGYKGGIEFMPDGKAMFYAFEGADLSTVIHEPGHLFLQEIITYAGEGDAFYKAELATLTDWLELGDYEIGENRRPRWARWHPFQRCTRTRTRSLPRVLKTT